MSVTVASTYSIVQMSMVMVQARRMRQQTARQLMNYFDIIVRLATGGSPPTTFLSSSQDVLEDFVPYSTGEVAMIIQQLQRSSALSIH